MIEKGGKETGCFIKDKFKNEFVDSWESALMEAGVKKVCINMRKGGPSKRTLQIDMSTSFVKLLAVKDSDEISLIK